MKRCRSGPYLRGTCIDGGLIKVQAPPEPKRTFVFVSEFDGSVYVYPYEEEILQVTTPKDYIYYNLNF